MPELPEVETVVRSLLPRLPGSRILDAHFSSKFVVHQDFATLSRQLRNQTIRDVRRHGKFILIELDRGFLSVHLGMTGKLLIGAEAGKFTRAVFELDGGTLVYDDIRHFGRIEWSRDVPERAAALGPDALTVPLADFLALLKKRHSRVKSLLLNQAALRGMGNIYTDEALFAARIHPKAIASRLSRERATRLHTAMVSILNAAIRLKGSSISDYVDADGSCGSYQLEHQVYGREGQPCTTCGGPVRRIVIATRGTHYCPKCQRA